MALWDASELRKSVFLPLRRRKHGNSDTKRSERLDPSEQNSFTAVPASLASFQSKWKDEKSKVTDLRSHSVTRWARGPALVSQSSGPADLNSPVDTGGGGCIPTYQPDGCQPITEG